MSKGKICYIVSDVNASHQLNAVFDGVRQFGYEVSLIFIGAAEPEIAKLFQSKNFLVRFIRCSGRIDFPKVLFKLYSLLKEIKPEIVHTQPQTASMLGLTAAKMRGIKKRLHTRHHSVELHNYHPHAVYYDKYCNALSARIIATSRNVQKVLIEREKVNPARVSIVHHGFRLEDFKTNAAVISELKNKYDLNDNHPVIGVISRFVKGKGIHYIIPAFAKILKKYPRAKLVLANAKGDYTSEIRAILENNLKPENYVLIEFETHIFELYKTFDIFIHVPIDPEFEAFGQTYIESLALEVPSIFTLSGIAADFIADKKNALVVDFCDSQMIAKAIESILENTALREKLVTQGKLDAENLFDIDKMIDSLDKVYSDL